MSATEEKGTPYHDATLALIDRQQAELAAKGLPPYLAPAIQIRTEPRLDAHLTDTERAAKRKRLEEFAKQYG